KSLLAAGHPPESICITARTSYPLRDRFMNALVREGIAADIIDRDEPRHPSVRLATMHRIKGLEFAVVVVVGVNAGEMPLQKSGIMSDDPVVAHRAEVTERCLLYVAASRARDTLYVTSFGEPSPFLVGMGPPPLTHLSLQTPQPSAEKNAIHDESPTSTAEPGNGTLLDSLDLPTRMHIWAMHKGVTTLEELVRWRPSELLAERNIGRRTISETRKVLEAKLGRSWEEAFDAMNGPVQDAEDAREDAFASKDWDTVRRNLPSALPETNLTEIDLPVRILSYAKRENLLTVADLATRSKSDLLGAKNLGRTSIPALVDALHVHVQRIDAVRRKTEEGFLESWKGLLQDQDPVRRMVFTRRAGLGGTSETLKSIGETLGVSRERARQIENGVIADLKRERSWLSEIRRRIAEVLRNNGAVALDELTEDPWWAGIAALPVALDYFGEEFLDDEIRIIEIDERAYLARCTPAAIDAAWEALRKEASVVPVPSSLETFRELVAKYIPRVGTFVGDVLFERLKELLHIEYTHNEPRVIGLGTTRPAAVMALLRASSKPMRVEEVIERLGRGHMPDEVLFYDRGLIGLEQHFPDFRQWLEVLVPQAIEVMQHESPDRQWLAHEIMEELRETAEFPAWLDHWHLASLLRRSGKLRYLGRNRFALLEAVEERGRILYHDELLRILRERGGPMLREELIAELSKKTTARSGTIAMFLSRPPFLVCDEHRVGLYERDLPGGAQALAEALEHIARILERRERGLGAAQAKTEISRLSQTHALWPLEMCMSVLRGDPRFRLSQSGAVGLAHWDTVRVPSRAEIVRECLQEADGRVTIEAVQRRIEAYYGAAPERITLGQMANRFGAVLRGEWLEQTDSERSGS
ncbi:MAG TPA: DNA-directed RNA polymerase subunit alpha C-terminal domain-containing protein, partial [Polyangium sp.]|nr:DNA-directed RNA polymerase subunit alpha C-terminal domain-containing protein [Polyangium sp.]